MPFVRIGRACMLAALLVGAACGEGDPTNPSDGPGGVVSIRLTPRADTIFVSDTLFASDTARVTGVAVGPNGQMLAEAVRFASADTTVAVVDQTSLVRARAVGAVTIRAQAGGEEASATITVQRATYTIVITPSTLSGMVGDTVRVVATPRFANGAPVRGVAVTYASSAPATATVDQAGLVRFLAEGSVTITARNLDGTSVATLPVTSIARVLLSVEVGTDHACGIATMGQAHCWGRADVGQVGAAVDSTCFVSTGDPTLECELSPRRIPMPTLSAVDAGGFFSCGLTPTGVAYCWGLGVSGRLGNGSTGNSFTPALVTSGVTFRSITAGAHHACGVSQSGFGYCWGADDSRQLGDFTRTINSTTPIPVIDATQTPVAFDSISAGGRHTCGLRAGIVSCWGENADGQLGRAGAPEVPLPVSIAGVSFVQVSAGDTHTCALASDGRAFCWGDNIDGRLGIGTSSGAIAVPTAVAAELRFTNLSAGTAHTCAVTTAGDAYCWGSNASEQSGGVGRGPASAPRLVPGGIRFRTVSAGLRSTCATSAGDRGAYCWGSNILGTLGNGLQAATRGVPVAVSMLR